jgi:hypothetical protein
VRTLGRSRDTRQSRDLLICKHPHSDTCFTHLRLSFSPFIFAVFCVVVNVVFATIRSVDPNGGFATDVYHLQTLTGKPLSETARVDLHNAIFEVFY